MVKYSDDELDAIFSALSDRTRRHVLASLAEGERQVTELAGEHEMSLPGFMKHLRVLQDAGLIARSKEGRVVSCELSAQPMRHAAAWMSHYEKFWTERLDSLGRYLYQQEELQRWSPPSPKKRRRLSPSSAVRARRKGTSPPRRNR